MSLYNYPSRMQLSTQLLLQTKGYLAGDCFIAEINVLFSPLDTAKQKQKNWSSSDTDEIYTAEINCYLNKAKNENCDKLGKIHVFLQKPFTFHFSNRYKKNEHPYRLHVNRIDIFKTSCYLKSFLPSTCKSKENIMQITERNSVSRLQVIT